MTYEKYLDFDRNELLEKLQAVMSQKRYNHVLGVEKAAVRLAGLYHFDKEKAGLAGLVHDYAKEVSDQEFLDLIDRYHLDPELKNWGNEIWHGAVGIYKIREELGLTDEEILHSIAVHTVGSAAMTKLDKIVYVADYIEQNRHFPGVEAAREIAEQSLDKAVAYETAHTVAHLAGKGVKIYPQTIETYNAYIDYLKND
ncbi:HD domain-containing protein [Streptococcus chenjunshii]|uniref:bis(5'-nucleosyl)-tetraphosphatase (symmetrical) n=1 Tax=Streptococcus chenjunshii TaxID=2173853 RepID=A0A372KLZ4_9STRE|nr:bis(5'-nucleosyl)-tetraphosphatase (symmetrical) YqeK [Streptococcus chenjunshii]AXQ78072.1 HD domain-containing protein [Streptococcus chenjunshii]RFU51167.1 HD domain-containing protein [Streptococcus chenjunshii]RFU53293.1 HD domain-containing protein [Streptococcus chenjunshii]